MSTSLRSLGVCAHPEASAVECGRSGSVWGITGQAAAGFMGGMSWPSGDGGLRRLKDARAEASARAPVPVRLRSSPAAEKGDRRRQRTGDRLPRGRP